MTRTLGHALHLAVAAGLIALAWTTWVAEGVVVPVVVASGSMAPTLLGPHRHVTCGKCGFAFDCDEDSLPSNLQAVCPNCGFAETDLSELPRLPGNRLLINRVAMALSPPRRWDVAIFRCPDNPLAICVKRIIGLPGERLQIRAGELYADGQLVRKSLDELRRVAIVVFDSRSPKAEERWHEAQNGWHIYQHMQPTYGGYQPPQPGPVLDDSSYNQNESRLLAPVNDLMVRCRVSAGKARTICMRIAPASRQFEIELNLQKGDGSLFDSQVGHDKPVSQFSFPPGLFQKERLMELALVDKQILLAIDGQIVHAHAFPDEPWPEASSSQPVALQLVGEAGVSAGFHDLVVLRDVYYTAGLGGLPTLSNPPHYKIGPDEYFVLGDNSPLSEDSRTWPKPGVPAKLLVGKPLFSGTR